MIKKRFKPPKNYLSFESETDKEIRSDTERKIIKNCMKVFENRQ